MPDKMLKFVKIGQQNPPKREVDLRKEDFNEIYDEFISNKAKEQSSRCSQWSSFLPGSLSFKQQYSRLAKTHCRGKIGRGISTITKHK